MYTVSPKYLDGIRDSHTVATYVDLYFAGSKTESKVPVVDGTVTVDRTSNNRRRCDLTIGDPLLMPKYIQSALSPYGAELHVYQGITFLDGTSETIPLGIFSLETEQTEESVTQSAGGLPVITAFDRSQVLIRDQFLVPADYSGWDIFRAITNLVHLAMPSAAVNFDSSLISSHLPGATIYTGDRFAAIQTLCTALGAEGYFDVNGVFQVTPIPVLTAATQAGAKVNAVWTVDASTPAAVAAGASPKGVLVTGLRGLSRTDVYNGVAVFGTAVGSAAQPFAQAFDIDPLSPTYWGGQALNSTPGPYGHVTHIEQSPAVTSNAQAQVVANALLANSLGLSRSLSFTSLPNPALDGGDIILAVFRDGTVETHILDSFVVPLNPTTGSFSGTTRSAPYTLTNIP